MYNFLCCILDVVFNFMLFTGDTLFIGGCGKFFEGTGETMYSALITILSKLPGNTVCAHLLVIYILLLRKMCHCYNATVIVELFNLMSAICEPILHFKVDNRNNTVLQHIIMRGTQSLWNYLIIAFKGG